MVDQKQAGRLVKPAAQGEWKFRVVQPWLRRTPMNGSWRTPTLGPPCKGRVSESARTAKTTFHAETIGYPQNRVSRRLSAEEMRHRHVHDGLALRRGGGVSGDAVPGRAGQ